MMRFNNAMGHSNCLLGLGTHSLLTLDQTAVWGHEDKVIYDAYDSVFGLRQPAG